MPLGIWENGGTAPLIHKLSISGDEWSTSHPDHFTPGERDLIPNEYEIGWTPQLVWTLWSRNRSLAPARNQTTLPQLSSP